SRGTRCRGAAWVLVQSRDRRWRPYKAAPPVPDGGDGRSRWVPTDGQVAVFGGVLGLPAASFSAARFRAHSTFFLVRRAFWRRRARASWGVDMTSSSWACDEGPAECTRPTKSGPPPSPTRRWTPGGPDIVSHLPGVSRAEQGPEIRRLRGLGPLVLLPEAGVVGRSLLREQHPEGHRELREWHAGEQVGQRGVRFVVDQDVLLRDDVSARVGRAEGDDLEAQRPWIQAEALVVLLAEQERLPVLDQQLPLLLVLLGAERLEGAVVEDVAVLVDLREGRSAVRRGAAQHHGEVLGLRVDGASDEAAVGPEGKARRIDGLIRAAQGSALGDLPDLAGGGVLPLGEPVDPVVEQEELHVEVPPQAVQQVVATDAQGVSVARGQPDAELGVGSLHAQGDGGSPAMDRVEPIGVHVVGKSAAAADPADPDDVVEGDPELGHDPLHVRQ